MGRASRRQNTLLFFVGFVCAIRVFTLLREPRVLNHVEDVGELPDANLSGKLRSLIRVRKRVEDSSSRDSSLPRFRHTFESSSPELGPSTMGDYCARYHRGQTPTIILRPTAVLENSEKRTTYMPRTPSVLLNNPASQIPMGLFPRLRRGIFSHKDPLPCLVYNLDTASFPGDLGLNPYYGATQDFHPPVLMFGLATSAAAINEALPLWTDWMGTAWQRMNKAKDSLSSALLLVPAEDPPEQLDRARFQLSQSTLNVELEALHNPSYEHRYFSLIRWLWHITKDRSGADEVDWYVLCDDDTYYFDISSALHGMPGLLNRYQSPKSVPYLVGSTSESSEQLDKHGKIAYSGAGIFVSRELMRMMNQPGQWDKCLKEFGHSSRGDAIVSWCAARVMNAPSPSEILSAIPGLHQIDIKGDGQGIFQAGWEFSSLHNFRAGIYILPNTNRYVLHDENETVKLIGFIARTIGSSNWGRRFVWGLEDGGRSIRESMIICLGFSVTKYEAGAIEKTDLGRVEATFESANVTFNTRPRILEGHGKRTFLIADAKLLPAYPSKQKFTRDYDEHPKSYTPIPEVLLMRYVDLNGEFLDIIWDPQKGRIQTME